MQYSERTQISGFYAKQIAIALDFLFRCLVATSSIDFVYMLIMERMPGNTISSRCKKDLKVKTVNLDNLFLLFSRNKQGNSGNSFALCCYTKRFIYLRLHLQFPLVIKHFINKLLACLLKLKLYQSKVRIRKRLDNVIRAGKVSTASSNMFVR